MLYQAPSHCVSNIKKVINYLGLLGASFSDSNILGCCCGLLAVPELDSLVESNADAGSEIFSPSDRAMALINISSCSLSLLEGLDDKLKSGANEVEGVS